MPTRSRAACVLDVGGSNRSDPRDRSSRRIVNEILRNIPMQTPKVMVTSPSTTSAAIVASEYFRVAVVRGFLQVPSRLGLADWIS